MANADAPITDLAVTYNMAAPDEGFARCAKLSSPAYVWAKRANGDPVTEVKLVYDNEEAGAGFTKIADSLTNASEKKCFLCFRKGGSGSPVLDLRVITEREPVEDGFNKIDKEVLRDATAPKAFVFVKTKASEFAVLFWEMLVVLTG